jgi:hypothetical protein
VPDGPIALTFLSCSRCPRNSAIMRSSRLACTSIMRAISDIAPSSYTAGAEGAVAVMDKDENLGCFHIFIILLMFAIALAGVVTPLAKAIMIVALFSSAVRWWLTSKKK